MFRGISGVSGFFEQLGVPLPGLVAPAVAVIEVVGGLAFILGAALPVAGTLLAAVMLGALFLVHFDSGFFVRDGGYEFVLTLAAAGVAIGFSGGGAFAVDDIVQRKRAGAHATV
ncbi:DoxX family protein [Sinosporangium album]|nr:DoxX family protein [Sinosporangium album]